MGLLDWIFKGKDNEKELFVSFSEACSIMAKRKEAAEKELIGRCAPKLAEIKHLLRSIDADIQAIEKRNLMEEGENKYLRKIVSSSQRNMAKQMHMLIEKLQPENVSNASGIRDYANESALLIQREIITFRRNISYTSVIMKDEIKNIGLLMQSLLNEYNVINGYFREMNYELFADFEDKAKELEKKAAEIKEKEAEISSFAKALEDVEKAIATREENIKNIEDSPEFKSVVEIESELKSIEEEKEQIRIKFHGLISNADKVIRRFIKLSENNIYAIDKHDEELLKLYMSDLFEASKRDPKAENFKRLLAEMKKAINDGILSIKENEKEKRLKAIEELAGYDYFTEIFWKSNELEKKKVMLNRKLLEIDATRKIAKEKAEKERLLSRKSNIEVEIAALQKEKAAAEAGLAQIREIVSQLFYKIEGKKISF